MAGVMNPDALELWNMMDEHCVFFISPSVPALTPELTGQKWQKQEKTMGHGTDHKWNGSAALDYFEETLKEQIIKMNEELTEAIQLRDRLKAWLSDHPHRERTVQVKE